MWGRLIASGLRWYVALACLSGAVAAPPAGNKPNDINCNPTTVKEGSTWLQNLGIVLAYLSHKRPQRDPSSVYTYGAEPDTVYAYFECYNTSAGSCSQCFDAVTDSIKAKCKLAQGGREYLKSSAYSCFLQYEVINFLTGPPAAASHPTPSNGAGLQPNGFAGKDSGSKSNKAKVVLGIVVASVAVLFAAAAAFAACFIVRKPRAGHKSSSSLRDGLVEGPRAYSYEELRDATEGFSEAKKLGQGGFGAVYKGVLQDGRQIAVKKLSLSSNRGKVEFVNEVNIISSIQHRNLVRLEGDCVDGQERMLVLEYLVNGSLESALFGGNIQLDWPSRQGIILGIAKGLAYLHEESHIQIIHGDIKPSNILLDSKLDSKISDFGISKLFNRDKDITTRSTRVAGTIVRLTTKADVFSFGVLVLEIVSGRRCRDPALPDEDQIMFEKAWKLHSQRVLKNLADPNLHLTSSNTSTEVLRALKVALLCIQPEAETRPTMSKVVAMLLGYLDIPPLPSQPPHPPTYFQGMSQMFRKPVSSREETGSGFLSAGSKTLSSSSVV